MSKVCYIYYKKLSSDTQQAHRSAFFALKNYTLVIDEVTARLNANKGTNTNTSMENIDMILPTVVNAKPDEAQLVKDSILECWLP